MYMFFYYLNLFIYRTSLKTREMEIKDFFDLSKPLKRVQISTFESKCVPRSGKENPYPEASQLEHSQDYAKEFQRIEEENFLAVKLFLL